MDREIEMEAKSKERDQYLVANRDRRVVYAFLSRMYEKEVSINLLRELTSEESPILRIEGFHELEEGGFREGLEMLSRYLRGLSGRDLEEVKLELAVEYAKLFLGIEGKGLHPSESVYRSKDYSMMQEPRDEVLQVYWDAGVDKVTEYTEPEDHIAIELQFMAYLCRKTVEALERDEKNEVRKYLEMQKKFIESHVATWVPKLIQDILENSEVDFYKSVAKITNGFIQLEKKALDDLIKNLSEK